MSASVRTEIARCLLDIVKMKATRFAWFDLRATLNSLDDTLEDEEVLMMLRLFTQNGTKSDFAISNLPKSMFKSDLYNPFDYISHAARMEYDHILADKSLPETERIIGATKYLLSAWEDHEEKRTPHGKN